MLTSSKFAEGDQPMKPQVFASSIVAVVSFAFSSPAAFAQSEPISAVEQVAEPRSMGFVHVTSPREHAEVAATPMLTLDVSPRSHDDWALTPAIESLDLSPATHDDWAL
jgi:hypothetical protein